MMPTLESLTREWQQGLGGASGSPLNGLFVSRVDSTQRLARLLLDQCVHEDEGPLPFVVVALEQTAGRGRQGRSWESSAGAGLYASLVFPVASPDRLQLLPQRVATALAEYLGRASGRPCRIKWPNDLVFDRMKAGGILVDASIPPQPAESWAVVGFGLNFRTPETQFVAAATSVTEEAEKSATEIPTFERFVVEAVTAVWQAVQGTVEDWAERYRSLSAHQVGDEMRFGVGDEVLVGRFDGFDESGFLRLATDSGSRIVRSGEVFAW